jgi:hypothetical protein
VAQDVTLTDVLDPSSMLTHLKLGGGIAPSKPLNKASQVSAFNYKRIILILESGVS